MLRFSKGFDKTPSTKIATKYNVKSDVEKLDEIRKRLHPTNFNTNNNSIKKVNDMKNLKSNNF